MIYKTAVYRARAPDARFNPLKKADFFMRNKEKFMFSRKGGRKDETMGFLIQQSEYYRHL